MATPTNAPKRLLIVEDDPVQRAVLKEMLKRLVKISKLNYHAKFTGTGKKALELWITWNPEIVLLDIHLPDISGIEVLQQLKANRLLSDKLILLMTADTSEDTAIMGLTCGAHDIIFKPFRVIELALKLAKLLDIRKGFYELSALSGKLEEEKNTLSKFFSADLMNHILKDKSMSDLGGIITFASIMFFDIRDSTHWCEKLGPVRFAEFINGILNDVTGVVYAGYGSVNKFTGDGFLATFGCPVVYANDAYNCVLVAEKIKNHMQQWNNNRPEYIDKPVKFGLGIATGKIFAGNIGSTQRIEYTVLGEPVNIAARLEALTKETETDVLIDQGTVEALGDIIQVRKSEIEQIRGFDRHIDVYELLSINEEKARETYFDTEQVTYANTKEIGEVEFF